MKRKIRKECIDMLVRMGFEVFDEEGNRLG